MTGNHIEVVYKEPRSTDMDRPIRSVQVKYLSGTADNAIESAISLSGKLGKVPVSFRFGDQWVTVSSDSNADEALGKYMRGDFPDYVSKEPRRKSAKLPQETRASAAPVGCD